jgi:hypothetical protein
METAKKTTMAQTEKITVEVWKRTVNTQKTAEETQKTAAVNKKTEGESLYQNRRNTCQMDGMTILYILKKKKLNQEQGQELVH